MPDFINTTATNKALDMLLGCAEDFDKVVKDGFLAMACNTGHIYASEIKENSNLKFVSLIDEVSKFVVGKRYKKIGLLASSSTVKSGLYHNELKKYGVSVTTINSKQKEIDLIIRRIISGDLKGCKKELLEIVDLFIRSGEKGVILGCTELPLVISTHANIKIISSLDILASSLINKYYYK